MSVQGILHRMPIETETTRCNFTPKLVFWKGTCREEVTIAFGFTYFDHQVSCKHNLFTPKCWSKQKFPKKIQRKLIPLLKIFTQKRLKLNGNIIGYLE